MAGCDHALLTAEIRRRAGALLNGEYKQQSAGFTTTYDYHDAAGKVIARVKRTDLPNGEKKFAQCRRAGDGWEWKAPAAPRPLYRLDQLAANPGAIAIVCEGEKAANACQRYIGDAFIATTWMGGANAVTTADWRSLAGRDCIVWPDNDEPGSEACREVVKRLSPIAKTVRVMRVDDLPPKGDAADVEFTSAQILERCRVELPAASPFVALDLAQLARTEPAPPAFVIPDWLPCGEVTLFAGHGGSGKSAIALLAAVCIASGRTFYGLHTRQRRVVFVALEDGAAILHWRLSRICAFLGLEMASLAPWLTILDGTQGEAALMTETRDGAVLTAAYEWLQEWAKDLDGLVIDGASDAFDANENERRAVRRFVRLLRRLITREGFVMLLAHVDKATAKAADTTQGYSGSTAWSNSARSRWYLRPDGEDGALVLQVQKANHAPSGASLRLEWNDSVHLFVGELAMPASKLDRELAELDERNGILAALRACAENASVIVVPAATTGPRTAFHVLSVRPEFPQSLLSGKPAIRRFWQQIERLRAMGAIEESSIRRSDRHYVRQFVISAEEARACGQ